MTLRVGVIGISDGNGHPYSWSAICNGYDQNEMEKCEFAAIPRYLEKQEFPRDAISDVRVTHVWTQDPTTSRKIAKAAYIDHIVDSFEDLVGAVDAVLLARDDAENHLTFAAPFLNAGLPVYIDKPFALSASRALEIFSLQRYPGQVFSCSALRYAREFLISPEQLLRIGPLISLQGITPKSWERYAVHVVEPILGLLPERAAISKSRVWQSNGLVTVNVQFDSGIQAEITATGAKGGGIALRAIGDAGWVDLKFENAFAAFRFALTEFFTGIRYERDMIPRKAVLDVVNILELGVQG